jgi:hypothetical protein
MRLCPQPGQKRIPGAASVEHDGQRIMAESSLKSRPREDRKKPPAPALRPAGGR